MGQLAVKFKEWREKLELSHEKAKHASSQYTRPEQRSLTSDDSNKSPTRDYGATGDIGSYSKEEFLKKLDMLECVLENQRKFLEDHDIKIQEIENAINKILANKELKDNQTEIGVQFKPEEMLDRLAGSTNEDENQAESRDLWRMFECHAQILSGHEERLENNITKIEIIREMLEEKKGEQEKTLKRKLKEYETLLKKRCESYEKLKKEVEDQLELQQKLQDNLLAGFIVGFVIMVMICMLPRTLLASG